MKTIIVLITLILITFNVQATDTLRVAQDGKVTAFMLGTSSSEFENLFTANFEDQSSTEVPRPAFLSNKSEVGAKLDLGTHKAANQLVLVTQVLDTGHWFYSIDNFNEDKDRHFIVDQIYMEDGTPALIVRFEETLGLGDADYNDQVVLLVNVIVVKN